MKMFVLVALLSVASANRFLLQSMFTKPDGDFAYVKVSSSAKAIDGKDIAEAVANAVAKIDGKCKGDAEAIAASEAEVVAQAIATAIAEAEIIAASSGSGQTFGSAKASAAATAKAVAKAVATGLAAIPDEGLVVSTAVTAVEKAVATAIAKVEQEVVTKGDAEAAAYAISKSSVLVTAIAKALALAAAKCDGKEGTVNTAAYAEAYEAPVKSETFTDVKSLANAFGDGFASVNKNQALATFFEGFKGGKGKGKGDDDDDDDDDSDDKKGGSWCNSWGMGWC